MKSAALVPLLALASAAPFMSGCAGVGAVARADAAADAKCRSPLRVCVNRGSLATATARGLKPYFADAVQDSSYDPAKCEVGLRYPSNWNDSAEIYSAQTKKLIGKVEVPPMLGSQIEICKVLAPGGAYAAQFGVTAPLAAAGAAAPAAAQGLSAADIERIAKAVQGTAPAAPAAASFPASPAPSFAAAERPDDLAVIVGIESYSDIASKAPYAERDADAFKAHVRALGVPERNIVLLKGAKAGKASLEKNLEAWLPRMAKADSRVYFYFSGHGAPDVKTGQAYLVPWDGDPNFLDSTAYPVAKLYKKLGELPAKQVLVAMDSCFSGAGGRSVLASGARPLVGRIDTGAVPSKVTVLAASGPSEISGSLDDKGHGAFTWFLLEGMNAGRTTPKALNEYLTPRVQDEARRLNRDQTPQLQGDGGWNLR